MKFKATYKGYTLVSGGAGKIGIIPAPWPVSKARFDSVSKAIKYIDKHLEPNNG